MLSHPGRKVLLFAFVIQPLWTLSLGFFFLYKWFGTDAPNRKYRCDGRHGTATCYSGESTNMFLGFMFTAIGVVFLLVLLGLIRSWRRQDRSRPAFRN